ncbi:hypothetical protein ACFXKC_42015 [Streptomyces sp. NPDC059340]|uniref:hypothetical protein n=1 Tax=Streptomyces sp. NPDC059340 TaxID=3346806 RepID=UPI0036A07F77
MSVHSGAVLATTVLALGGSLASGPVADAAASPPVQHHSAPGTTSVTRVLTLPTAAGKPLAATVQFGPDRLGPAPRGVPAAAAARKWHYRSVRATLCMLNKKPYWGGPKSTASCGVGYASLAGEVAYNGKYVWGQWIDCQHKAIRYTKVTVDWCGTWNNGGRGGGVRYMDLGLNGTVESPAVNNTFWIRIDAYRNGKVALRGGNSRR